MEAGACAGAGVAAWAATCVSSPVMRRAKRLGSAMVLP